jgi:hypothetical protein
MPGLEHQQCAFEALGGDGTDLGIVEQVDERLDVVATEHGAEEFGRLGARNQRTCRPASADFCEELGFDLGGIIDTGGDAVGDEINERGFLALGRSLQQRNQFGGLLLGQGQGRDALCGAFGDMGTVGFEHGVFPFA